MPFSVAKNLRPHVPHRLGRESYRETISPKRGIFIDAVLIGTPEVLLTAGVRGKDWGLVMKNGGVDGLGTGVEEVAGVGNGGVDLEGSRPRALKAAIRGFSSAGCGVLVCWGRWGI